MTSKDKVIKKLVKASKRAMKHLEFYMPGTPGADTWDALRKAIKAAERLNAKA